jgi:hypothetical protein
MAQSRRQSLFESLANTALGFTVSFASTFAIFPLVGIHSSGIKNLQITLYFTAISILRGYLVRRFYNRRNK